jgi:hypothetical protein
MTTTTWSNLIWQNVLSPGVLVISFVVMWLLGQQVGRADPDFIWIFAVAPVVGFLIGYFICPASELVVPIGTVIMWEMVIAVGRGPSGAATNLLPIVLLIGLPLWALIWIGKRSRSRRENRRDNERDRLVA